MTPPRDNGNVGGFGNTVDSLHTFTELGTKRAKKVPARAVAINAVT